jgi:hypothetical protein
VSSSLTVASVIASASQGSSGMGPVVIVVGLTIASALILTFLFNRLPGSNENTGASPFSRRRRKDPFGQPPDDPMDRPPSSPFDR